MEIRSNGRIYSIRAKKVRTLLAMMALSPGRPVSYEQLADELWGPRSLANSRNALQANIARLRRLFKPITDASGEEIVRTTYSGYQLEVSADSIDSHRFLELARRGTSLVASAPQEATGILREALVQWRGPALMDVQEGVRCRAAATHLNERRLTVQEDLIAARLAVGQHHDIVHELRQLATENPGRERLSELLMLALYRTGQQSEALSVFHRTSKWLGNELGLSPGRALRQLYQAILVQDCMLD
ncbi:AfsR/SARP family transcriptional regulator [Amycolatopsis sp. NPDC024027]|uniref:AfsR/SARP family transcriptional regulator n=1 Tax=Amycolatopsis sp. NPDC024027 TaxID=3154327 RepID=UPI0033EAB204